MPFKLYIFFWAQTNTQKERHTGKKQKQKQTKKRSTVVPS